jgi:hypothetical protein
MIILGHKDIKYNHLYKCNNIDDIKKTPSNSIIFINNIDNILDMIEHCNKNNILFAIEIYNIKDLMIYSSLKASYILIKDIHLAKQSQQIAENYMFDTKIGYISDDYDDIETVAINGIDAIVFKEAFCE